MTLTSRKKIKTPTKLTSTIHDGLYSLLAGPPGTDLKAQVQEIRSTIAVSLVPNKRGVPELIHPSDIIENDPYLMCILPIFSPLNLSDVTKGLAKRPRKLTVSHHPASHLKGELTTLSF